MAGDAEQLAIDIEARVAKLEAGMGKAQAIANKAYSAMKRSSKGATDQMEADMQRSTTRINQMLAGTSTKIGSFGRAFAGGIGAGMIAALAPMALFQKALEAINDASHIVDVADKVGITTTALQELGFGFSQAGVEAATFETGMEQFSRRIGEAATRGGKLADILKANGISIRGSNGQIRSSVDLLRDFANLVKNATSEQEKMLLVTEAFGRGGGDMLAGLNDGAKGIDKMGSAARKAGVVIDEELLRRAEEMGDRWDEAWMRFKVSSQSAILSALDGMAGLGKALQDFENRRNAAQLGDLAGSLVPPKGSVITGAGKTDKPTNLDVRMAGALTTKLSKADQKLVDALKARYGEAAEKATVIPGKPEKPSSGGGGSKSIPRTADDRLRDNIQAVKDNIAALQEEQATLGMSFEAQQRRRVSLDLEQAALRHVREEARRKGQADWENIQLSQKQKDAIDEVSAAYAAQADALRQAQESMDLQADVLKGAFGDIRSALEDGKITIEEWGQIGLNIMDKLIDKIENDLVDAILKANSAGSEGGGGGIFGLITKGIGFLFGGAGGGAAADPWAGLRLAGGGDVRGPGTSTSDSIPAMLSNGEFVVNAKATKKNRGILEAINSGADWLSRAAGGPVSALPLPGGGVCDAPRSFGEVLA